MNTTIKKRLAQKYAQSLAKVELSDKILAELNALRDVFESSNSLLDFIQNPSIKSSNKADILELAFKSKLSSSVMNLVKLLFDKRRLLIVTELADAYQKILLRSQNITDLTIYSAYKLSPDFIQSISSKLETSLKQKLQIKEKIDESLVSGIKLEMDNKVLDLSIKNKLKKIRSLLLS